MYWCLDHLWTILLELSLEDAPGADESSMTTGSMMCKLTQGSSHHHASRIPTQIGNTQSGWTQNLIIVLQVVKGFWFLLFLRSFRLVIYISFRVLWYAFWFRASSIYFLMMGSIRFKYLSNLLSTYSSCSAYKFYLLSARKARESACTSIDSLSALWIIVSIAVSFVENYDVIMPMSCFFELLFENS